MRFCLNHLSGYYTEIDQPEAIDITLPRHYQEYEAEILIADQ